MGIDHVGIGSDFDGDGGIRGFANASEVVNFTRLLLKRGYSDTEIKKIWGMNFRRVIVEAQSANKKLW
jgi:microsomal dipeptidase-like Zn-dependent dipeptidase